LAYGIAATKIIHDKVYEPFMAMAVIGNSNHPADLVAFHHTSLFSPSISTLEKALDKEYLPTLPGLTKTLLKKYQPDLEATTMGHIWITKGRTSNPPRHATDDWTLIGKKSKPQREPPPDTADQDAFPDQDTNRSHHCYIAMMEPTNLVYSDQANWLIPHPIQQRQQLPPNCLRL